MREHAWKIKTNRNKFQIIPRAVKITNDVDGNKIDSQTTGKF